MRWRLRGARPRPDSLEPGERVLAGAHDLDGEWCIAASRSAVHLRPVAGAAWERHPWHLLHSAGWDGVAGLLSVRWRTPGGPLTVHAVRLREAPALLETLRERIASTVVVQRSVEVPGGRVDVVVRQVVGTVGDERLWIEVDHDEGVDLLNPQVRAMVAVAQAHLEDEVGAPALATSPDCC